MRLDPCIYINQIWIQFISSVFSLRILRLRKWILPLHVRFFGICSNREIARLNLLLGRVNWLCVVFGLAIGCACGFFSSPSFTWIPSIGMKTNLWWNLCQWLLYCIFIRRNFILNRLKCAQCFWVCKFKLCTVPSHVWSFFLQFSLTLSLFRFKSGNSDEIILELVTCLDLKKIKRFSLKTKIFVCMPELLLYV